MIISHNFIEWLISINLYIPLFLKIDTKIIRPHSFGILFDQKLMLNNLVSQSIATFTILLHTSMEISFGSITLCHFIFLRHLWPSILESHVQSDCRGQLKRCLTQWTSTRCLRRKVYRNTSTICSSSICLFC
jgi:hypothetical protein